LNAIAGVGMISVGTIGSTAIGTIQDADFNRRVQVALPDEHDQLVATKQGLFNKYEYVDKSKYQSAEIDSVKEEQLEQLEAEAKQRALTQIAILPAIMCVCYLALIAYFRSRGGYQAQVLTGHAAQDEKFTGGIKGPVEA
jgi:hypothetical protein